MTANEILTVLKSLSTPDHLSKLVHFGINDPTALGIKIPLLRQLAKEIGKNHELAIELWDTGIHEARLLASMIEDPKKINEKQFDAWVNDFDSWDICDQTCSVFGKKPFSLQKIIEYSTRPEEFVKRTAFVLMCDQAIHHKNVEDEKFYPFLEMIEREAWDDRNFVRKAVNWALRQIGKRNERLRFVAIETSERIVLQDSKSARWIARDALRELHSQAVVSRSKNKTNKDIR